MSGGVVSKAVEIVVELGVVAVTAVALCKVSFYMVEKEQERREQKGLAQCLLNPRAAEDVRLEDVGGLEEAVEKLRQGILRPLQCGRRGLFRGSLARSSRGVLLYGPPGTGKTMLAKALANATGLEFLVVTPSLLRSMWYGESEKTVRAVWALARKKAPAVLFIDEVDAVLGMRGDWRESEVNRSIKTEFMQHWDGIETGAHQVVVMGATNRKEDLDDAVLRRFTLQLKIGLPDAEQRAKVLACTLRKHEREVGEGTVDPALLALDAPSNANSGGGEAPLREIARRTEGYSCADLRELCARAEQLRLDFWCSPSIEASSEESKGSKDSSSGAASKGATEGAGGPSANTRDAGSGGQGIDGADSNKARGKKLRAAPGALPPLSMHHFVKAFSDFQPPSRAAQERRSPASMGIYT